MTRQYVLVSGLLFALLVVTHLWRAAVEGAVLARQPFFLVSTVLAAAMTLWAVLAWRGSTRR
jgi:hypothetical protein